jgi:hypothetical protein
VFSRRRVGGEAQLVVVLPDGSRLLIPASWTAPAEVAPDKADPVRPTPEAALPLLTLPDLLATRTLLDALLRRSAKQQEETNRATAWLCYRMLAQAC